MVCSSLCYYAASNGDNANFICKNCFNRKYIDSIYIGFYRIRECSEWAQCLVLDLVSNYVPSDSNEIFDIMNLLEDRLQHANGAVVLATIKVFLHLTLSMNDVHQQVPIKELFFVQILLIAVNLNFPKAFAVTKLKIYLLNTLPQMDAICGSNI